MDSNKEEILQVLNAVVNYLSIDLPCQSLTPDAQMGRTELLDKVETLYKKLDDNNIPNIENDEIYDDVDHKQPDVHKRFSSYMSMDQFSQTEEPQSEIEGITHQKPDMEQEVVTQDDYEVTDNDGRPESNENPEGDICSAEFYEDPDFGTKVAQDHGFSEMNENSAVDNYELTEDELLKKLKSMENTNPKIVCNGSLCSGKFFDIPVDELFTKSTTALSNGYELTTYNENDAKATGVIVLPGYCIEIESRAKFIFKLSPIGKGRSTYRFQLVDEAEMNKWVRTLSPICSQKLDRLKSEVFNRVAKQLDEKSESDEGSGGEKVQPQPPAIQEELDNYEFIPADGLHSAITPNLNHASTNDLPAYDEYDDQIGIQSKMNSAQSEPVAIIQEDIYEDIPAASTPALVGQSLRNTVPSPPLPLFTPQPPPLSPRSPAPHHGIPALPPRGTAARPGNENVPLPPSIPSRKPAEETETVELIEEESDDGEEQETGPAESDFSYDNVYIGTVNFQSTEADELTFERGDLIYILEKINPHWWVGCLNDKTGLVKSNVLIPGFAH
eukprot:gene8820-9765_t